MLLVDASLRSPPPFTTTALQPARDASWSRHALSPGALLQVYRDLQGQDRAPCTLLAIRGERFELGEAPSQAALDHLEAALAWAQEWVRGERQALVHRAPPR